MNLLWGFEMYRITQIDVHNYSVLARGDRNLDILSIEYFSL